MGLRKKVPLASVTLNHLLPGRGGQTLGYWFWREHSGFGSSLCLSLPGSPECNTLWDVTLVWRLEMLVSQCL